MSYHFYAVCRNSPLTNESGKTSRGRKSLSSRMMIQELENGKDYFSGEDVADAGLIVTEKNSGTSIVVRGHTKQVCIVEYNYFVRLNAFISVWCRRLKH